MNLDNEELIATKHKRKLISYTKQVASGKLDKNFYNAYCELYDLLCEYMNAYNRECKDYEQTINELYEEKERYRKLYFEEKEKGKNEVTEQEIAYYEKLLKFIIDDRLLEKGLEINEKNEARTIQAYKDHLRKAENKVTEQELKDMIIGMLE